MDMTDFPRHPAGAISGVHPKVLARKVGDSYITGWTEQERRERYESCSNLVEQLVAYCQRKSVEHPEWSRDAVIDRTTKGVDQKIASGQWDVTNAERDWIIAKLQLRFV